MKTKLLSSAGYTAHKQRSSLFQLKETIKIKFVQENGQNNTY